MALWIILTSMAATVAIWAAIPFLRGKSASEAPSDAGKGTAVYRDQLRQIASDVKAGTISEAEADATRAEVARRLVVAEREEKTRAEPAEIADHKFVAIGIAAAIAVGSAILYARIGEPERIPATRTAGDAPAGNMGAMPARHPAVTGNQPRAQAQPSAAAQGQGGEQGGLPTVDGMIERLAQRLKANPNDADGWRMLGWSYASQGRLDEAGAAYEEAIKRQPENGDLYGARGEILVRAANGVVSPEAARLFEETLKRDGKNPRARYFLGLRKDQSGDRPGALADWIAILQTASPDESWARELREHVERLAAEMKIDLTGRLPAVLPAVPPPVQMGGRGPGVLGSLQGDAPSPRTAHPSASGSSAAAQAPAQQTAEADRAAAAGAEDKMIRSMVDGLAQRLEKQPRDLEGWSRLIRSRKVLGEVDKAKTALAKAREIFADAPDALAAITATARELGLDP